MSKPMTPEEKLEEIRKCFDRWNYGDIDNIKFADRMQEILDAPSKPPVIKESLTTQEVLALVDQALEELKKQVKEIGESTYRKPQSQITSGGNWVMNIFKRLLAERGVTYDPERLEHFAAWWNTVIPDDERKIRDQHLGDYFNEYPQPERNPAPFDQRALLLKYEKWAQSDETEPVGYTAPPENCVDRFLKEHPQDEAPPDGRFSLEQIEQVGMRLALMRGFSDEPDKVLFSASTPKGNIELFTLRDLLDGLKEDTELGIISPIKEGDDV